MEIGQYLRERRVAAVVALALPLLAMLAAYVVLSGRQPEQAVKATVSVPASTAVSASRIGIFVADFAEVATSTAVVDAVSESTGESKAGVKAGIDVVRLGQSSLFEVNYTAESADKAEAVVRAVIADTYARLVGVGAEDAEDALVAAQKQYEAAVAARRAYENEIGTLQPDRDYADLSSRIRSLQTDSKPGNAAIALQLIVRRDALVPQVRRAQELSQSVDNAADVRDLAREGVTSARSELEEARGPRVIQELSVSAVSLPGGLLQGVLLAGVLGAALGLAVLVLPDLLAGRGAARSSRSARDDEAGDPSVSSTASRVIK